MQLVTFHYRNGRVYRISNTITFEHIGLVLRDKLSFS